MRTAKEWAQMFSESLYTTHPATVEAIMQNAMDEAMVTAKDRTLNTLRDTLTGTPYFFQPEIVDEIITRIKMYPVVIA